MSEIKVNSIVDASGGNTATINGVAPNVNNIRGKNKIINGDMQVHQRGTTNAGYSGTFMAAETYTVTDRFFMKALSPNSLDQISLTTRNVAEAPSGSGFSKSCKITVDTPETTIDADEYVAVVQRIESQNLQNLQWGTANSESVTLSFWARSSVAGTYAVCVRAVNGGSAALITDTYTLTANTWQKVVMTFPAQTIQTILNDSDTGAEVWWFLAAGSNYTSTDSTSWISYTDAGAAFGHSQNGVATTTSATWQITGVQLEAGDTASGFEHLSYGETLAMCQRYYQLNPSLQGAMNNANDGFACQSFGRDMRANPSYSIVAGTGSIFRAGVATYNINSITSSNRGYLTLTVSSNFGANIPAQVVNNAIAADAEL